MKFRFKGISQADKQRTTIEIIRQKLTLYEYAVLRADVKKELTNKKK